MAIWLRRAVLAMISIALVLPIFVTPIPPMLDYAGALAIVPGLGSDPIMPLLARIVPLPLAGKFFLALALILPLLGTVALHDAIFNKRSWWPLASAIIVYNAALLAGFVDFTIGIGLALLGTAAWIRMAQQPRRQLAVGAVIAVTIVFIQTFSVAFFLLMIGSFELRGFRQAPTARQLQYRVAKLAATALPSALIYLHALVEGRIASPLRIAKGVWWTLAKADLFHKAIGAAASFFTYDLGSDLLILIAVAAALAALALANKLSFAWPLAIGLGLMLAYLLVTGLASSWTDIRLPVLAGFLLFAGITPRRLGRRETAVLGLAFAALIVARLGVITLAWQGQNADLANIAAAPDRIDAQDRVVAAAAPQARALGSTERTPWARRHALTAQLN